MADNNIIISVDLGFSIVKTPQIELEEIAAANNRSKIKEIERPLHELFLIHQENKKSIRERTDLSDAQKLSLIQDANKKYQHEKDSIYDNIGSQLAELEKEAEAIETRLVKIRFNEIFKYMLTKIGDPVISENFADQSARLRAAPSRDIGGYSDGQSERADIAEAYGKMRSDKLAKYLKSNIATISKIYQPQEYHHFGKNFKTIYVYTPEQQLYVKTVLETARKKRCTIEKAKEQIGVYGDWAELQRTGC